MNLTIPDHPTRRVPPSTGRLTTSALVALMLASTFSTPLQALQVRMEGGESAHQAAVADTLPARRLTALEGMEGARFWIRRLPQEARKALQPFGYYSASVDARLDGEAVVIAIDVGQPVTVESVSVSFGPSAVQPTVGFPLKPGQVLDHQKYERGKQAIHSWLLANGYLKTRLTKAEVRVHQARHSAEVELAWDPGPQYRFGPILFEDSPLDTAFLQRYVPMPAGATYLEASLQKMSENLRTAGYFGAVEIQPQMPTDDSLEVPLKVVLTPRKRSVYEYGVNYATDAGPGVEAGLERRWINRQGHSFRAKLELASRRSVAALRYQIPSSSSIDRQFLIDLNYVDEETDSADRQTTTLSASRQSRWGPWLRTEGVSLLSEDFTIGDVVDSTQLLLGSLDLAQTSSDGSALPRKGWRARVDLQAGAEALQSDVNLVRVEAQGKIIWPLGSASRLLVRGQLGALWSGNFDRVPASLRFFAGGDSSVRGFDYESLGPRDEVTGQPLGGEAIAVAGAEFDWPVRPGWRGALFVDAGNAFGTGDEAIAYAVGVGLRWLTPVGPLRLDLAAPLSDSNESFRLHFSAGPDL